ncbi:L,D-transpeptidase family protein [Parvularcula dongshanensis]|uniref:L,D-peptidoglycan transpeptidase YkuD (ErfK/YbiS/YcfS/YnhG family) n=1 Tax=Parvularcula dongshanensis TaxID=1173995 RepID=A0A840I1I8_9PROT|nr:L,D-transpeptidase family protein [Parvularcula dongshanensis]MBB4658058.1 L,D-peptidoglycan transpeptidase YkuD (ErfK/YbiS/YcfS/YnhG family) [Parvularcula dongshanensis]
MGFVLTTTHEDGTFGFLRGGNATFPCAFGRAGVTDRKREGDGATPLGRFRLRSCYWRPDRGARPSTGLPTIPIRKDLGWCDDPDSALYNRPVRLPFAGRHERMWREDRAYDLVVVLDQNIEPARPGGGSAVFWHLTKSDAAMTQTEGCVAVAPDAMRTLLARCDPATVMEIRSA